MKTIVALFCFLLSGTVEASAWIASDKIPFIEGPDYCEIRRARQVDRHQARARYIDDAIDLLYAGATGGEALAMIMEFDRLYDKHKRDSLRYLNRGLEELFRARFQTYFNTFNPSTREFNFVQNEIFLTSQAEKRFVFVGMFSFAPECNGRYLLTLKRIEQGTGIVKTYEGRGSLDQAVNGIVNMAFQDLYLTQFPSTIQLGANQLTILGNLTGQLSDRVGWATADRACQTMGGRLPTADEVRFIAAIGSYHGGITVSARDRINLFGRNAVFVQAMEPYGETDFSMVNDKTANYFCVR